MLGFLTAVRYSVYETSIYISCGETDCQANRPPIGHSIWYACDENWFVCPIVNRYRYKITVVEKTGVQA